MYRKIGIVVSVSVLVVIGIIGYLADRGQVYAQVAPVVTCDSGSSLSYDQAVVSIAHGELVVTQTPDLITNHVTMVVTNNTPCFVAVSMASYKMFGAFSLATVSSQEFVDGTPTVNIAPATTQTFTINIPACAAQYDLFYGDAPHVQVDNHPYGEFLAGNHLRIDQFCQAAAIPPTSATLHVIKLVVNASGGTANPSNFSVSVKNAGIDVLGSPAPGLAAPGTSYLLSPGTYTVSETANASYVKTFTGDCNSSGSIVLSVGDDKICTIVNTDIPLPAFVPVLTLAGGAGSLVAPLIGILKVPTPLALPGGPAAVTYNYTVWNVAGQEALTNISITDDKCSAIVFLSGDTNSNGNLDPGENWKYSCVTTLLNTTTNTAVVTGKSNTGQAAIATAISTVVVSPAPGFPNTGLFSPLITPPLINIVKVPSRLTPFPFGGGNVTYTYTVVNPGVIPLYDVAVTDDKCNSVSRISGDTNGDNLLDSGEEWIYSCQTNITSSTRNVATAIGKANGITALGYAFATVLVSAPGFPNTGYPPKETNNGVIVPAIMLVLISLLLFLITRLRVIMKS